MRDLIPITVFASSLLLAGAASADVPPPNTQQCASEKAGDGCTTDDGKEGTCVASTCSKLDYSHGSPPGTIEYECKICQEGSTSASSGSSSGSGSTGSGSGSGGGCLISAGDVGSGAALLGLALPLMFLMRRRRRSA